MSDEEEYTRARSASPEVGAGEVLSAGTVLMGRFRIQRLIGQGGMGLVFAAVDLQMQGQPPVAIKLLNAQMRAHPVAELALQRECRKVRMLAHDGIVRVFEFYRADQHVFITMELLDGESLDALISRSTNGLPLEAAWPIISAAADALGYAHRQTPPFVHSDFKPSNVFLTTRGQVKLLDFGVARAARAADATASGVSLFDRYAALTPAYASREMLAGLEADPRDDVYALACVTYELLSGHHPFERQPADRAHMLGLKPAPIAGLGERGNAALAAGLALERADRIASVAQLVEGLAPMATSPARAAVTVAPEGARTARKPRRGGLLAVASILLGGIAWLWMAGHRPQGSPQDAAAPQSTARGDPTPLLETAPRRVSLGSTPQQIDSALQLCAGFSRECQRSWYEDEAQREVTLQPFELDRTPASVAEFREFVEATGYRTTAERTGTVFAVVGSRLVSMRGGDWRRGVGHGVPEPGAAVGALSFEDAQAYCRFRNARLPTEDEWEYVARAPPPGAESSAGSAEAPSEPRPARRPAATDGPAEGPGALYRGLIGNVWQWVDTTVGERRVLKGASWLEANPANRRAAVRRYELPDRADETTGVRCARSADRWPDAQQGLSYLADPAHTGP